MTAPNTETFDPLVDEAPSRFVVGIDLGTTNSAVTYIDTEESPWKIRVLDICQLVAAGETESLDTLPSFYFQPVDMQAEDRHALKLPWDKKSPGFCVGAYARDETARTSGRGIASAKSWLCHAAVDRTAPLLPWHGASDVQKLSPVEVSGKYLRHIRKAWDQKFGGSPLAEQDIILTLPASFDEVARELTIEAAATAGLPRVVLIEEPQAAFYAWVYKNEADWQSKVEVGQKILVCDIGGGTTDFTLIRVRQSESNSESSTGSSKVQFHRVAVGNHLILGGDNLDLTIARHLENKLTDGGKLEAFQWDVLVGSSRNIKEQMLSDDGPESITVTLPGRGSKLIGSGLQTDVKRDEIRQLILNGFLPDVEIAARPERHASGFQEFGLPYASDPAITKYLAEFLTTHARAGLDPNVETDDSEARPDVVLFNGGFFASPVLRATMIERISKWFGAEDDWQPDVLENDRLDLAVARGAAYYGMVRRDDGVRIAASLARSYYIGIGGEPPETLCLIPGNAEPGQSYELSDSTFHLTLSQPVEFSLYVSSTRLADLPGQKLAFDPEQMTALPPIRTVLRTKSRNEKRDVPVHLHVGLSEIGTIELSCHEVESDRSWKLQFDIRATTQTDVSAQQTSGESEGLFDEGLWLECEQLIDSIFGESEMVDKEAPKTMVKKLADVTGMHRGEWPMPLLRRIWEALIDREEGRSKSAQHEARWLNLLGYSLRPGYGIAMDDWRVTETWRTVNGKQAFATPNIRNELLILWRRLAGGLSRGQQSALAEPMLASLRGMARKMAGQKPKGNVVPFRPDETMEVWRLLGSLELLSVPVKQELGDLIVQLASKPKLANCRDGMIWALGRIGQRTPLYGPLNSIVSQQHVSRWISSLMSGRDTSSVDHLAVAQMARLTEDRYRDLPDSLRQEIVEWMKENDAAEHLIVLVREGGSLDIEEQARVFGESLPQGLRLE